VVGQCLGRSLDGERTDGRKNEEETVLVRFPPGASDRSPRRPRERVFADLPPWEGWQQKPAHVLDQRPHQ
jgi:hypothetical protein